MEKVDEEEENIENLIFKVPLIINVLILRLCKSHFILNLEFTTFNSQDILIFLLFIQQNLCLQCPELILCWVLNSEISMLGQSLSS